MQAPLGFEQTPPIAVPLRFLLAAPVFLLLAGMLLAAVGETALASRWSAPTLALVHLLTLGFMLQAMFGALLQFLPVAVGASVPASARLAAVTQPLLALGALALAAAFFTAAGWLATIAGVLLAAGLLAWLPPVVRALWPLPANNPTTPTLKLALAALGITVALGAVLALRRFGGGFADPYIGGLLAALLTDIHAAWGLVGWSGLLLAGVAWVVVPMFQLTPPYPPAFTRRFAGFVVVALLGWSTLRAFGPALSAAAAATAGAAIALAAACFATLTLWLQARSKRSQPDTTFLFWRTGMLSLLFAGALYALHGAAGLGGAKSGLLLGALTLCGFLVSVINGMLYKIVPFLCWLHAQDAATRAATHTANRGAASSGNRRRAPHMGSFIGEAAMRGQFYLHLVGLLLLFGAVHDPAALARVAGIALAASAAWLLRNLLVAVQRYRKFVAALPSATD